MTTTGQKLNHTNVFGMSLDERFEYYVVRHSRGCWEWNGPLNGRKRPCFKMSGVSYLAHRVSFLLSNGVIPSGKVICHKCDNIICTRPSHLFIGTQRDNIIDMVSKDRQYRPIGDKNPKSKLSEEGVRYIRKNWMSHGSGKHSTKSLAVRFGICEETVRNIVRRKLWSHLD